MFVHMVGGGQLFGAFECKKFDEELIVRPTWYTPRSVNEDALRGSGASFTLGVNDRKM